MAPSGHKAFLVQNIRDVDLLLMHNNTYAAEYVKQEIPVWSGELIKWQDWTCCVIAQENRNHREG